MQSSLMNIAVNMGMGNMTFTDFKLKNMMTNLMQSNDANNWIFAINSTCANQMVAEKRLKKQILENNLSIVDTLILADTASWHLI